MRVAVLGCLSLVGRRTAVRAVSRHNPRRTDSGTLASRRLFPRLLLPLDVIVQCALLQRRDVNDHPAPICGIVADRYPLPVEQRKLDLGYPVRVAELLSPAYLREAPCLRTAGRWLVKTGEFLMKLGPLAVSEFHGHAHPRYPAVVGGGLVPHDDPLDGSSLAEELFALGLGQRPVVLVMMKQFRDSPQVTRERKELSMRTARADSAGHGITRPTVPDLRTGLREDYGASGDSAAPGCCTVLLLVRIPVFNLTRRVNPGGDQLEPVA